MIKNLKIIILSGLFATPFIPLIVMNSLFFPFITGKAFVFRIIIEIVFCVWVILMVKDPAYRLKKSWLLGAISAFVGVIFLADIFGVDFYRSFWSNFERMDGLITLLHLFAYFIMLGTVIKIEKIWNYFFNTTLVASTLLCLFYALPQIYGGATIHQSADRVDATLGNATYLAVYALIHIFIALYLMMRSKNIYLKLSYVAVMALQFLVMYKTQTRGAMLGLVGGLFISMIIIAFRERERKTVRKISIGILVALVVVTGSFFALRDSDFVKKSPTLSRFAGISLSEDFLKSQGRYYIWPMAISGFKENPILGWGQENFNYVFSKNFDPRMYNQEQWFDRAHNVVLDWLVAGGLLGLLAYLSIFVALLYCIWRGKGGDFSVSDKSILTGLVCAYFFQNLFVFDNISSYLLFFALLAYVYAMRTPSDAKVVAEKLHANSIVGQNILISITILFTIFVLYSWNIKPIQANRSLLNAVAPEANGQYDYAKDLESFKKAISYNTFGTAEAREHFIFLANKLNTNEIPQDLRAAVFQGAATEMDKQIKGGSEPDARYYLFLGSLLGGYGLGDQATFYLKKAHELSPKRQSVYFEMINVMLQQGKNDEALAYAKEAYELDPTYLAARVTYFTIALRAKKPDLAKEIMSGMDEKDYIFDDRILGTYIDLKKNDEALAVLERRIELDPKNPQYRLSLSAFYLSLGNKVMSKNVIKDFIAIDPAQLQAQGEYYLNQIDQSK